MKNGDLVYCENGHVMCEVVDAGMVVVANNWGDAFGKWRCEPPMKGGPMPVCHECGGGIVLPDRVRFERNRQRRRYFGLA